MLRPGQHEEGVLLHSSLVQGIRALTMRRESPRGGLGAAVTRDCVPTERVCEKQQRPESNEHTYHPDLGF